MCDVSSLYKKPPNKPERRTANVQAPLMYSQPRMQPQWHDTQDYQQPYYSTAHASFLEHNESHRVGKRTVQGPAMAMGRWVVVTTTALAWPAEAVTTLEGLRSCTIIHT